jgi:histidyl-tRNA synthetase
MATVEARLSGTRDYIGEEANAFRRMRASIAATFSRYAYLPIEAPILERSSPFLDRSGEDIRRHMYIFNDPGGREVCLRPELTISACRVYVRHLQAPERATRLCYFGPAFRYDSPGEGRYRQFFQFGAEIIGGKRKEVADAEVLALALDALEGTGIQEPSVIVGDLGILNAFIEGLSIEDRLKMRLRRIAVRKELEDNFSAVGDRDVTTVDELAAVLNSVGSEKAGFLIREVLGLADVRHIGRRTSEEIVERLISRTTEATTKAIPNEILKGIAALLDIRGDPETAFAAVQELFSDFGLSSIEEVRESWAKKMNLFKAYRETATVPVFDVGLRRAPAYYTGFVFEIRITQLPRIGHLCAGGRYDNLLQALGASSAIPAVGFAIGMDRLVAALDKSKLKEWDAHDSPTALVVPAGAVRQEDCVSVSNALRKGGWSIETEISDRKLKQLFGYADKRKIRYVVVVGEDEIKEEQIKVKRLKDGHEDTVPLMKIEQYARAELAYNNREKL